MSETAFNEIQFKSRLIGLRLHLQGDQDKLGHTLKVHTTTNGHNNKKNFPSLSLLLERKLCFGFLQN